MDSGSKKARIVGLTDEVKELHPLLRALFSHLSGVNRVEYTHGTFEFGADFVLFRHDQTFGDTEYIGVIVKVGDIRQDILPDIERQFDEADTRRFVLGGKKEIFLSLFLIMTKKSEKEI